MTRADAGPTALRVTVADAWQTFRLEVAADETAAAIKRRALAAARIDPGRAAGYELKLGGALVRDEALPVARLGVKGGASLVVLARRRRPAR